MGARGADEWGLSHGFVDIVKERNRLARAQGFRGATLQLDLFTRKGKFPVGFCHIPIPPFHDEGRHVAAQVNFSANGEPDQPGSGNRALAMLFHEAGHAAHLANIAQNAPSWASSFRRHRC